MNSSRTMDASDIALVHKVQETPSLYDPLNPDFKFAFRKEQIWNGVASYLGISSNDARRRWTCLRDRYSRELKQRRSNPHKIDNGSDEFFNTMDFLRRFVRRRRERRRIVCNVKANKSWDGVHDIKNPIELKRNDRGHIGNDHQMQENGQETYTNKIEIASAEVEDSYQDYVEDEESQLCEPFEEYHMQHESSENTPTIAKFTSTSKSSVISAIPMAITSDNNSVLYGEETPQPHTTAITMTTDDEVIGCKSEPATQVAKKVVEAVGIPNKASSSTDTEDDYFCKSICGYLRQLSRVHKIKAKVEMFQILEKYIELEDSASPNF